MKLDDGKFAALAFGAILVHYIFSAGMERDDDVAWIFKWGSCLHGPRLFIGVG